MCERERERESVCVCVRERECVCVCVWGGGGTGESVGITTGLLNFVLNNGVKAPPPLSSYDVDVYNEYTGTCIMKMFY